MAAGDQNVIIAYDGSEHSEYALEWYAQNMHKPGKHIILLHVPELNDMLHSTRWANSVYVFDREVLESMLKEEQKRIQKDLERFADKLKSLGLGGKVKSVAAAKPGEGIASEAKNTDAELVVVGSRGMGAVRRTLLGSVSDYLVHHCQCPVLVVKHPKHFHSHEHGQTKKD
ncbi:hypothetical protein BaRGS_00032742 [Batillaria attramentaria]|uniref:UspA domain-containing protein n=1 Tax=Batillaria attramentaria TaxID=370345 RepID=A0ABD0JMZ3_9CAEN|nr:hypothetical protein BaRGS_017289 [Batillaria attramentaria]